MYCINTSDGQQQQVLLNRGPRQEANLLAIQCGTVARCYTPAIVLTSFHVETVFPSLQSSTPFNTLHGNLLLLQVPLRPDSADSICIVPYLWLFPKSRQEKEGKLTSFQGGTQTCASLQDHPTVPALRGPLRVTP